MKKIISLCFMPLLSCLLLAITFSHALSQDDKKMSEDIQIKITVGDKVLHGSLLNNATTKALIANFPLTVPMMNLYNREMCYRFPDALPTDNVKSRGYKVGEIVYWPPRHSLVIMYAQNGEHFDMQQLGKIDSGFEIFNSLDNVSVTFSLP